MCGAYERGNRKREALRLYTMKAATRPLSRAECTKRSMMGRGAQKGKVGSGYTPSSMFLKDLL